MGQCSYGLDATVGDADVGVEAGRAGAVDDGAVQYEGIESHGLPPEGRHTTLDSSLRSERQGLRPLALTQDLPSPGFIEGEQVLHDDIAYTKIPSGLRERGTSVTSISSFFFM